jgi:hypothetical protein
MGNLKFHTWGADHGTVEPLLSIERCAALNI